MRVLTPHPSPLPVEGRGSGDARALARVNAVPRAVAFSGRPRDVIRGGRFHTDFDVRRAPSPLKGERAGVRGEAVRLV